MIANAAVFLPHHLAFVRIETIRNFLRTWPCEPVSTLLLAILPAALILALFWPTRGCDFINLDAPSYVVANTVVASDPTQDGCLPWAMISVYMGR